MADTWTIAEAARRCGCPRSTLQRAVRAGRLHLDADHRLAVDELIQAGYLDAAGAQQPHASAAPCPGDGAARHAAQHGASYRHGSGHPCGAATDAAGAQQERSSHATAHAAGARQPHAAAAQHGAVAEVTTDTHACPRLRSRGRSSTDRDVTQ